jgi:hypothetical protein
MSYPFRKYRVILYAAAYSISCCFLFSCENSDKAIEEWTKDKLLREEAKHVESFISQGGAMKARLTAPVMYRVVMNINDSLYVEFPNTLHVDFYNDSMKIESRLDSRYGKYFENLDKVYLKDSVVVISVKGDTLKCQDLWWDQKKGLFYSDKYSRYIAKGQDLQGGKGLEATQDMKTVTFKEPTGIMEVSGTGIGN